MNKFSFYILTTLIFFSCKKRNEGLFVTSNLTDVVCQTISSQVTDETLYTEIRLVLINSGYNKLKIDENFLEKGFIVVDQDSIYKVLELEYMGYNILSKENNNERKGAYFLDQKELNQLDSMEVYYSLKNIDDFFKSEIEGKSLKDAYFEYNKLLFQNDVYINCKLNKDMHVCTYGKKGINMVSSD